MEALTSHRTTPPPGLNNLVLNALATVDTWASDPGLEALAASLDAAGDDASAIPTSVGQVLPLLAGDRERLLLALELVLRLDLFEAANGLDVLVWRGDTDAVLAAAALASHPGVTAEFRDLVIAHGADLTLGWQRDLFLTRTKPDHEPEGDSARVDRTVRWFPRNISDTSHPVAALAPPSDDFAPEEQLRLAVDLAAAGTVVRRVPSGREVGIDERWLPRWASTIGPAGQIRPPVRMDRLARQRLVATAMSRFTQRPQLRAGAAPRHTAFPDMNSIDVFDDGAFPRQETAFLSGLNRRQVDRSDDFPELEPILFRGQYYWKFSQLVGYRAASYLFRTSGRRRGLRGIANRLVRLARSERSVPVGITETGEVVISDKGTLINVETGQTAPESIISLVDRVYAPFPLESGTAPALMNPSLHTSVHPTVVRGAPCVTGTRVTAMTIHHALRNARLTQEGNAARSVVDMFPELSLEAVWDADRLVNDIRATR